MRWILEFSKKKEQPLPFLLCFMAEAGSFTKCASGWMDETHFVGTPK